MLLWEAAFLQKQKYTMSLGNTSAKSVTFGVYNKRRVEGGHRLDSHLLQGASSALSWERKISLKCLDHLEVL